MSRYIQEVSKFISTAPGFQYSINLNYDLSSLDKIRNYIATSGAIDIIEDVLLSVDRNSNDRARLLIGPYGKGKSHLVLVLVALLYYKKDKDLFSSLLEKVYEYNKELYELIIEELEDQEKMLPVIISGNNIELNQSFLSGLKDALTSEGISDIMPNTYFNAAADMIRTWKEKYTDTYKKFGQMINTSQEVFVKKLEEYDETYYQEFLKLYPILTSGGEFRPLKGIDMVDLYSDVAKKIKSRGYKGIFVIYDEFSKFLEGSIERNSAMEIKMLQDFAEKCNRSADAQMHIMLISHKNISSYVERLPKEKVDAWKAIGDRFKTIEIHNIDTQMYEIMANVIEKDSDEWKRFTECNIDRFNRLISKTSRADIFSEMGRSLDDVVVYGGYPLHPTSVYMLPKISEKVAQNERTIFTFLSTSEKNTLGNFLITNEDEFPLLTIDYIYNYFEVLFKKENYASEVYKIWRDTTNALKKIEEDEIVAQKIVKALGLIYILEEFQNIPPTKEMLKVILCESIEEDSVEIIIENLIERKILYFIKSKGYLKFIEATDIDVNVLISDTIEKRKNIFDTKNVLNDNFHDNYIYPTAYNDEHEIIRYFDFEFIDFRDLKEIKDWNKKIENKLSDGVVYALLMEDIEEKLKANEIIKHIKHERLIFVIPNKAMELKSLLQEYDAIEFLIGKNEYEDKDKLLHEELSVHREDIKDQITNNLNIYQKPELGLAEYYYQGKKQKITRKALLSRLISKICENVYSATPVIINEMINKNEPTTTAINNRRKVVDGLLQNTIELRLGLTGYGQDVTIMQSTLVVPGILKEENGHNYLSTKDLEPKMQNVLDTIKVFLLETSKKGKTTLEGLYCRLTKPDWKIGMKKGVIPIYLAVILHELKPYTTIYRNGYEMDIDGRLLDDINEKPEDFEIYIENWDEQKELYIKNMEDIFCDYINEAEREYNTFEYIVRAIRRWFLQLPNYTKEYTKAYKGNGEFESIDIQVAKLRNSLKGTRINSRELLFSKLFKVFNYEQFTMDIVENISSVKNILDYSREELINSLALDMKNMFYKEHGQKTSFYSVMKDWYEDLNERTKEHLFNFGEEKFLEEVKVVTNDHISFIEKIAKIVTGLRVEDWNDKTVCEFISQIKLYKDNIERFNEELNKKDDDELEPSSYKIQFITKQGEEKTKTFDKVNEFSEIAVLMYNEMESVLEGYGEAIEISEKRQVIMKILEKYC